MTTITVINFAIYLSFLSIEYMFRASNTHDLLGMKTVPITQKLLADYDFGAHCKKASKPIDILRQAAIKIKALMILSKAAKTNVKRTYNSNPLLYQYFYLIFVFLYMNFVVFFWIPAHRNPHFSKDTGFSKFVFNESINKNSSENYKTPLNYLDSTYAQTFYLLNVIYITFSLQQIRVGKKLIKTNIIDFRNLMKKIKFYAYIYLPLVREVTTTFEYSVHRTCLKFTDFMLLNDIKAFMNKAKLKHITNSKYPTGKKVSRTTRLGTMILVVNVLIIALVLPLFLFSIPKTTSSYKIESGSLTIDLVDQASQRIGTLFKTDKFISNRKFNISSTTNSHQGEKTEDEKEIDRLWEAYPSLNKFSDFQFHKVTLSKYSDIYLDFTPKILEDLSNYLRRENNALISVNLTLYVSHPHLVLTLPSRQKKTDSLTAPWYSTPPWTLEDRTS